MGGVRYATGADEASDSDAESSSSLAEDDEDDDDAMEFAAMSDEAINMALAPSIYTTARALKRSVSSGAYHRLHSIAIDREFVRVRASEASAGRLPVFANARAGTWYAPQALRSYFKSTDGHCNNWSFSSTRLNARVAFEAAENGGGVIVDATGSNLKRFPDALAKTVPIWADVLNRACAATMPAERAIEWLSPVQDGPHLPCWISDLEKNSIQSRVVDFMASFEAVKSEFDARSLATVLKKPFRCVWTSRDDAPAFEALDSLEYTPLVLITASAPLHWRGERRVGVNGKSFSYIPGAGDDEESWARGLTPALFDAHAEGLLGMNESDVARYIKRIVDGNVATPHKNDPLVMGIGCAHDAFDIERDGVRNGAVRLGPDCGLGDCALASIAVYARADVGAIADAFLHVGETAVVAPGGNNDVEFLHVPARRVKYSRNDLALAVPACVDFVSRALHSHRRVCITCDDGVDHCVAIAVAVSLALRPPIDADNASPAIDKSTIRARLARVCASHPNARPSRGSLKQIHAAFNRAKS